MSRLVWAFAGRIYHITGNLMLQLNYVETRILVAHTYGPSCEKTWLLHANNKGADQPAHVCSLISPFVFAFFGRVDHLSNFGRGYYEDHFCEIILNLV